MSIRRNVTIVFHTLQYNSKQHIRNGASKGAESPIYSSCLEPDYVLDPFKYFVRLPSFFLSRKVFS